MIDSLDGLAAYPATLGSEPLRAAIAAWVKQRYGLASIDPATQVLPVSGSREALFALAQTVIDSRTTDAAEPPIVLCPNPFYQIYEGAALLAGAEPYFVNSDPARNFACDYSAVPDDIWARTQLLYVCSPGNPTGAVLTLDNWRELFALSDKHGFVIASDECYSEIYFDEAIRRSAVSKRRAARSRLRSPRDAVEPVEALERAGHALGLRRGRRVDPEEISCSIARITARRCRRFFSARASSRGRMKRTCATTARSICKNSQTVTPMLADVLDVRLPDAAFYLWANVSRTGLTDTEFAARLYADYNVTVLPGSFLARSAHGTNPGEGFVRIALVAETEECVEGARRIVEFCRSLSRHERCRSNLSILDTTMSQQLQSIIDTAWENRAELSPKAAPAEVREAVAHAIEQLDKGQMRVAEKRDGDWVVNQWLKKAVLLSFRLEDNAPMPAGGYSQFYDKVPSKFASYTAEDFAAGGFRVVPPAIARRGSFIAKNVVLMPSYTNIGAYVDEGSMVDTWATVGSCAQIGKNVHLSGGVGIGGVLEPLQANPVIIEDNCFIGARSEVVEGVIVEENSVISMGVYLGQSTKIYDRETGEVSYGRIPAGSVVVAGNLPSKDGSHSLYCAVIVKKVDAKTRAKVGLNELLRGD